LCGFESITISEAARGGFPSEFSLRIKKGSRTRTHACTPERPRRGPYPPHDMAAAQDGRGRWPLRIAPQATRRRPVQRDLLFDISWREHGTTRVQPLVVRLRPTGFQIFPTYDLWAQFRIMECLAATNVPVPRVRWFEEDPGLLGCPFYVMEQSDGVVP